VDDARPTVLIIEDNAITRADLAVVLHANGYAVATAPHGRHALDLMYGGLRPAVILLDVLMPEMDGWHFLDWLRGTRFEAVPVIIMTGSNLTHDWALSHNCSGFLAKPINEGELLAEMRSVLKGG
jgi:two-component system, chemotaxis family, chemotaxis protein CheY